MNRRIASAVILLPVVVLYCISLTAFSLRPRLWYSCKALRYRPPPRLPPVALASYAGSGNTWLRHLLQQSTGYLTGSMYSDDALRPHFPAEKVSDGSVLVVKTHDLPCDLGDKYRAAVLLVRKPADAILAEFNRRFTASHTAIVPDFVFNSTEDTRGMAWKDSVLEEIALWTQFQCSWLVEFRRPLLVLTFERLREEPRRQLARVLGFLNETVSEKDMDCAMRNMKGNYRRHNKNQVYPFSHEMQRTLAAAEQLVGRAMARRGILPSSGASNNTMTFHIPGTMKHRGKYYYTVPIKYTMLVHCL